MTDSAYERLVDHLDIVRGNGTTAMARCPAHEDSNPSLSLRRIEGSILLHCFAGCDSEDILATIGLTKADLYDDRKGATYSYADGRRVHRSPDKRFWQDGNTNGRRTVLFRLDKVTEAVAAGRPVYVVEGEKDVLAVESLGAVATTAPMGSANWPKVDTAPLHDGNIIVVPDADAGGRTWVRDVLATLDGHYRSLEIRAPKTGKDPADHIAAGHSLDELYRIELVDDDPSANKYDDLYLTRSALVDLPRGEPLIDGVLDRHTLFVIAGRDQSYKSFLALDWLACLATGHPWMNRPVRQTKTLYVVGEGAWGLNDRVAAWESAWGYDIDDTWFHIRRAPVNLFHQTDAFADLLDRIDTERYGVVIFDTLQRMASGADQNSAKDAGIIIGGLDRVRHATDNGAVGVVAHTDKGDNDTRGSSAFEDDADTVWRTKRDEDSEVIKLILTKRKDGPAGLALELRPEIIKGTGSLVLVSTRGLPPTTEPKRAAEVLQTLAASSVGAEGLSASAIADTLGLAGKGSIHKALSWLIDKQFVDILEHRRWPTYKITVNGVATLSKIMDDGR